MDLVDECLKQCKLRARIVKKHAHSKSLLFVSVVFYNRELLVEVDVKYEYEDSYSLGSVVVNRNILSESDHCDSRLTVLWVMWFMWRAFCKMLTRRGC